MVDLARLTGADALTPARATVLDALIRLCRDSPAEAARALGLGPTQAGDVVTDAGVLTGATLPAVERYTGVLFAALEPGSLTAAQLRPVRVFSGLWGVVAARDRLPAYRLAGGVNLPGLGPVAAVWRAALPAVLDPLVPRRGVMVDLRSSTYAAMWSPPADLRRRVVSVRVLTEGTDGVLRTVSHDNKAIKGRLARVLLVDPARTPADVAERAAGLGRSAVVVETAVGPRVDVVVAAADLRPCAR